MQGMGTGDTPGLALTAHHCHPGSHDMCVHGPDEENRVSARAKVL